MGGAASASRTAFGACPGLTANVDEGVNWLFSFLSADRRRTYCLYEAPSPDAIIAAARRANVPVDSVIEVERFVPAEHVA